MGLTKRADTWYFVKRINGQRFRVSTGFADKKSAERRAVEIEHDIRSGILGWKSTIPSFAEWWAVYRATYSPTKSSKNRDAQIVAHFLPLLGAKRLDTITKSDVVRYMNIRRTQLTVQPGPQAATAGVRAARCVASAGCCRLSSNAPSRKATRSAIRSAASSAARTRRGRACSRWTRRRS